MSKEIIEAVHALEREKGIESDTLIAALEDALLAAYKKTPGSTRHATVALDRGAGDLPLLPIELPSQIEECFHHSPRQDGRPPHYRQFLRILTHPQCRNGPAHRDPLAGPPCGLP